MKLFYKYLPSCPSGIVNAEVKGQATNRPSDSIAATVEEIFTHAIRLVTDSLISQYMLAFNGVICVLIS